MSPLSLSQSTSHLRTPEISVTRMTDYPGHTLSPAQSPGSIRHSSLSVSEGSLASSQTSEGSIGHDRNTRPTKRILKKPHGPRKHKSNRVRWNIPEEGSDTASLLSFESTSTTTSAYMYQQARNGVNEAKKNWREFEEQPLPGSTGLTPSKPSKPSLSPLLENYENVDGGGDDQYLPPSLSPPLLTQSRTSTSPPFSPLTPSLNHPLRGAAALQHASSTPLRGYDHASQTQSRTTVGGADSAHSPVVAVAPPTSVPLLRLDHSNLSALEESTFEDRAKGNLFEIPNTRNSRTPGGTPTDSNSRPPAYSGYIPPEGKAHLCGGSDADDYDHLNPKTSPSPSNGSSGTQLSLPSAVKTGKRRLASPPPPLSSAGPTPTGPGDSDIDEALNELSSTHGRSSSPSQSPLSVQQPGGPPNNQLALRGTSSAVGVGALRQQSSLVPTHRKHQFPPRTSGSDDVVPPPVPPKLRKQKSMSPLTIFSNGLRSSVSPSSCSSSGASEGGAGGETYPASRTFHHTPPDFAAGPARVITCHSLSQEEPCEDALSSVSNATLVPDSNETGPHMVNSVHSNASNTPKQQAKVDRANKTAGVAAKTTTRVVTGRHVHPETLPSSFAHSALAPHSWKESGTTKLAHHPPPLLPYHRKPLTSAHSQESHLRENHNFQRQAIINVSNSGSDSSLRGASPPNKISQAPVIQTQVYGKNGYSADEDAACLSQPLPVRHLSSQAFPPPPRGKVSNSGVGGSKFQFPYNQNPPGRANVLSRNQRLYQSHRSGLGRRQRGASLGDDSRVTHPHPAQRPPNRGSLKFQYSLDSLENPLEEISKMSLSHTLPYTYHRALSQDDHLSDYPRGLGGGLGFLRPPQYNRAQETHTTRKQLCGMHNIQTY